MKVETFYITTPIYYPNAPPHVGHAYTTVFADVMARYKKLLGYKVLFLTGNDEHGLKIQKVAEKQGKSPKEFTDEMAEVFKRYWKSLDVEYDHFIRTTDSYHERTVKEAFNYIYRKGLIYRAKYTGLYCIDCEKYYSPGEYVEVENKPYCPLHNKPLEYMEEETYYFKLSEFKDYLLEVLKNRDIVHPRGYAEEVISKVEKEGLRDVSIARPIERVWWGIPVPFDEKYVIYVWFDALLNYVSAIGYLEDREKFNHYWANVHHIIGKDILWFHTVVWFSILRALDLEPPRKVIVHAFLTSKGTKMSKSVGNIVSIEDMLKRYGGSDGARYVIMRIFNMDKDSEFDFELLDNIYATELADTYGNLVRRVGVLAQKKTGGKVYRRSVETRLAEMLNEKLHAYVDNMENFEVTKAAVHAMDIARLANQYLNETKPWEKSDPSKELYTVLEAIRLATILLYPFTPRASTMVARSFGFAIENPVKSGLEAVERYNVTGAPILFKKPQGKVENIKGAQ
ncbi:MAG: methionine--tRNA ligase [Desulfurococcaceae archaeon]